MRFRPLCAWSVAGWGALVTSACVSDDAVSTPRPSANDAGQSNDACTADIMSDPRNCGGCGVTCGDGDHAVGACVRGTCTLSCAPLFGDCDGNRSNGCELNLSEAPNDCGACGRSCAGGLCSAGKCVPREVVSGEDSPSGLVVVGDMVYFGTKVHVHSRRVNGDSGTYTRATAQVETVVTDGTYVYWGTLNPTPNVSRIHTSTGVVQQLYASAADALAVDADRLYISDPFGVVLHTLPLNPLGAGTSAVNTDASASSVQVDDMFVYYVTNLNNVRGIYRCPKSACTADAQTLVVPIKETQKLVYLLEGGEVWFEVGGTLKSVPKAPWVNGTKVRDVTTLGGMVNGMIADAKNLYMTLGTGQVVSLSKSGGAPSVLATGQPSPWGIAQDATFLYWTTRVSGGGVFRVAK